MEGNWRDNLQGRLEEREAEVCDLRDRLEQSEREIDRLRQENGKLRKELKAAGRSKPHQQAKRKAKR